MKISHLKNAFENIKAACEQKLAEHYPAQVPEEIFRRYQEELNHLKNSEYIDSFEPFHLLSKEAVKCSMIITARGTVMGSFIYYLLGNNCFNPLPVHYYCPKCGYYEAVNTHLFGIDLPDKECPHCKTVIHADGYNLASESVWGNDGKKTIDFEYNVCTEFLPFARRVLQSLYPQNDIVPWGMFQSNSIDHLSSCNRSAVGVILAGYAILPMEHTIQDYPDLMSYLEDGEPCVTGGGWELRNSFIEPVKLFSLDYNNYLIQLQRATGIYTYEISSEVLRNITWSNIFNTTMLCSTTGSFFHELKPKTFHDMVALESSSHSTFTWQEPNDKDVYEYKKVISSEAFQKYPCFTREDFFDYLLEAGVDRTFAFDVSERIRKGHAVSSKFHDDFHALPIPEEIKEVAGNYLYVFPRAHCIEYMLLLARIAYYAKIDSRTFSKIVFKK